MRGKKPAGGVSDLSRPLPAVVADSQLAAACDLVRSQYLLQGRYVTSFGTSRKSDRESANDLAVGRAGLQFINNESALYRAFRA